MNTGNTSKSEMSGEAGSRRTLLFSMAGAKPLRTFVTYLQFFIVLLSFATAAVAESLTFSSGERQVSLLELFTSQGCSSCPPAEKWLSGFTESARLWKEVVPVAFHVDYWDRLGWKDDLARPAHSRRQYQYQKDGNISTVYTPGFVLNGYEWRGFFKDERLPDSRPGAGVLRIHLQDGRIEAKFDEAAGTEHLLNLAVVAFGVHASIDAGENAGRVLAQDFVVIAHDQNKSGSGRWQSELPKFKSSAAERYALVAWVSRAKQQAPLQAAGAWLPVSLVSSGSEPP